MKEKNNTTIPVIAPFFIYFNLLLYFDSFSNKNQIAREKTLVDKPTRKNTIFCIKGTLLFVQILL